MRLAHKTCLLVTDGSKSLFLRNEGGAESPDLKVLAKQVHDSPADRDQKTSAPGRVRTSLGSSRRSAYEETDFHQREEDLFALRVADFLRERVLSGNLKSLIVVAPPKSLGELRKHYHREVSRRISAEIPKDLVKHPVATIARIVAAS